MSEMPNILFTVRFQIERTSIYECKIEAAHEDDAIEIMSNIYEDHEIDCNTTEWVIDVEVDE